MENDSVKFSAEGGSASGGKKGSVFRYFNIFPLSFSILIFTLCILLLPQTAQAGLIVKAPPYIGLQEGLVGFWSFDGPDVLNQTDGGEIALDRSGNNNNGELTNGPKRAIGKIGQGLSFDGGDGSVTMGDPSNGSLDFGTSDFSISVWVSSRGYKNQGSSSNTITGKWPSATDNGWGIDFSSNNIPNFAVLTSRSVGSSAINNTGWRHIVGVRENGVAKIYVDTIKGTDGSLNAGNSSNTNTFRVGSDDAGSGTTRNLDGLIDDVRVYNRALSADEVHRLYKLGR